VNATATEPRLMTFEEFEALPTNDGVDRWLIRGELREKPMTQRNRFHAKVEARIAHILWSWVEQQPKPRGEVYSGEVGCKLRSDPDTGCGIDVAYFSAETVAAQTNQSSRMVGPPILAVEILSPNDTQEEIEEKVAEYQTAGVPHVWLVTPRFRTVTVFRLGAEPTLCNMTDELTAEPELPGFRVAVSRLFEA
jgi:Uma2 family endonuclease